MSERDDKTKGTGEPTPGPDSRPLEKDSELEGRRRFVKAGIAGVPVILTLRSRPAWGNASIANPSLGVSAQAFSSAPVTTASETEDSGG